MQLTLSSAVALVLAGIATAMPIVETNNGTALLDGRAANLITGGPYEATSESKMSAWMVSGYD